MANLLTRILNKFSLHAKTPEKKTKGVIADTVDSHYTGLVDAVQSGWYDRENRALYTGFVINPEDSVLDLGCGAGEATMFAAEIGAHVIYIDSEQSKVDWVHSRVLGTSAREQQGIVSKSLPIPLPDKSVSKVIAMEMLEHVTDPASVINEMARVGKVGAQYLITVPDTAGEELQKAVASPAYYQAPNHINIFQREEIRTLLEAAGLQIISHDFRGFYWTLWMSMYWALQKNEGQQLEGAVHDQITPPFDRILENWSSVWLKLIITPGGKELKKALDQVLAKNQIIIARKVGP